MTRAEAMTWGGLGALLVLALFALPTMLVFG